MSFLGAAIRVDSADRVSEDLNFNLIGISPRVGRRVKTIPETGDIRIKVMLQSVEALAGSDRQMADSETFEKTCAELVECGALDQLLARGTIRIMLKAAGLEAKTVAVDEMQVVVEKRLAKELLSRGVQDAESVCRHVVSVLERIPRVATDSSPEAIFARLGGES